MAEKLNHLDLQRDVACTARVKYQGFFLPLFLVVLMSPGIGRKYGAFYGPDTEVLEQCLLKKLLFCCLALRGGGKAL